MGWGEGRLTILTFSSMTCLRVLSARTSASLRVRSLRKFSCSAVWAPSLPEPMALASYLTNVPEGSVWYL